MTDSEFQSRLAALGALQYREDHQTALCDLYTSAAPQQRGFIRTAYRSGTIHPPKSWRNPTDYDRSDLPREKLLRESLILNSIVDGGDDYRDDLLSIAYLYHNLLLLDLDADAILRNLAELSAPKFAQLLLNFADRTPSEKAAKNWGLKCIQSPNGPIATPSP
jgi:hypothetical protein